MTARDLSRLTPGDAVVAFRSFPRRYAEAFASIEGDETVDELATRVGPDGESALQIVSDVTRTWTVLGEALRQVLQRDDAVLHRAVLDRSLRSWDAAPPDRLGDALELVDHEAGALADQVAAVLSANDWQRQGSVAGGGSVTALDLVKDAVDTGSDGLRRVDRTLRAVRG